MSRCFSSLPRPSRSWSAPHLFIRSSLLLSQSSGSSCVSHELLGWVTRREAGMEEQLIYYSKGITRFPSLTSTPTSFLTPGPWLTAASASSRSQKAEMLWLKWEDSPDWGSPASFSWVWGLLCWPLGCLLGWGSWGVMTSLESLSWDLCRQRKQNGNHSQHCWLQGDAGPLRFPVQMLGLISDLLNLSALFHGPVSVSPTDMLYQGWTTTHWGEYLFVLIGG